MSDSFSEHAILADMDDLIDGSLDPAQINSIHEASLSSLERLKDASTLYFIIGNYADNKEERVRLVQTILSKEEGHEAFLLKEIDPSTDIWENFYIKFRVFLNRNDFLIGVFEDNDGGHELELGEGKIENTYVLKREYMQDSINRDIEHEKYDAMIGTYFDLLDRRNHLYQWTTETELKEKTELLRSDLN